MIAKKWPCIFARPEIRQDVNPRLQRTWRQTFVSGDPPYAAFQRTWRRVHCATINPYGSEDCPYEARDCILAYWKTATDTIEAPSVRSIAGLFRMIAQRRGFDRAENKPLARDRPKERTFVQAEKAIPAGPVRDGDDEGQRLRIATPRSIASLFGTTDPGPLLAPPRRGEGEEGSR